MPELPEVELLSRYLNKYFKNKELNKFEFKKGKFNKKSPDKFNDFSDNLPLKLTEISRKGKVLILNFDNKWWICIHFGLHGFLRSNNIIVKNYDNDNKSIHGVMSFENNNNLNYVDTTGFGSSFNFINNQKELDKYLNKYAIDILDKDFTLSKFKENLKKIQNKKLKRNEISGILLKSEYLCSGIGNYLNCEILYDCAISPYRSINDLTDDDISKLFNSINKIVNIHLNAGGKSVADFKVYQLKVDKNKNEVIHEKTPDNRMTYWIKEIQK